MKDDKYFIRRTFEIAENSKEWWDAPFGAIVVKNGEIIAESENNKEWKISDHAEILVLDKAHKKLWNHDLSGCVLYSNCEPCPMCSFMIREYKISKVVFSVKSKFMWWYSKWNILEDEDLLKFSDFFGKKVEVVSCLLEEDGLDVFKGTILEKCFWSNL